ncbi:MAG: S8 family serine peptidase [Anaerolineales bacterium]|nr:S8 family serine peptidase [Anaerolineales bacterium]
MKRKSLLFTLVLVILLMATSLSAMGKQASALASDKLFYVPDLLAAEYAFDLIEPDATTVTDMPVAKGFWTDMVDTENVSQSGEGVYVAVLDTGLLTLAPFLLSEANVAWDLGKGFSHDIYWDETIGDIVISDLKDDRGFWTDLASGHGTHVASTIVGFNVNDAFWVDGVAPAATIIPVLVLDAWVIPSPYGDLTLSGGTDEMVSAGIYYVADLAETLDGPVIINMSLGGPEPTQMIEDAIDYAIEKGVIVVASAGNEGAAGLGYPGGYPQVINAGAAGWASMFYYGWQGDVPEKLNTSDILGNPFQIYLEDFSSRPNKDLGQKHQDLDVAAPGAWVVGPYKSAFSSTVGYYYLSGTSMAAPHVTGISALVMQDHPELFQADLEAILRNAATGTPLPAADAIVAFPFEEPYYYISPWDGGDYGKGFLTADEAITVAGIKDK